MNKWYIHDPESVLEKETHTFLLDFDANVSPNLSQTTRPNDSQKKKKKKKTTARIVKSIIPADQRVKMKESEKRDKYLDLARDMKIYET